MNTYPSFELHHLVNLLDSYADRYLMQNFGISYSRFLVLLVIDGMKNNDQHAIAKAAAVGDAVISRMIPRLESDGYITSSTHPLHGRKKTIALTTKGLKIVREASMQLESQFMYLLDASNVDSTRLSADITSMATSLKNVK